MNKAQKASVQELGRTPHRACSWGPVACEASGAQSACPWQAQWSWASSSYFSQNLSVKGMQVRNSHHSQRTG